MKRRGGRRCGSAVILAVCLHCTVPAFGQDSPKLSTDIESRGGTANVVARKAGWLGRMTVVSGGIMLGVTDYKFDRWKTTQRVEHDGKYALVASKGGDPNHPSWYHNVKAHPQLTAQDGDKVVELTAREVSGDERQIWWDRAVAAYPPYAEYQTKTDRLIPVFIAE